MPLTMDIVPEKAVVIRREKRIVAACWYGPWVQRPYVYPFRGPGGCEVTRLGHPEDPIGHSHHRSIWIAHHDVGGVDFWGENRKSGRIVVKDIGERVSPGERVGALLHLSWQDAAGREILQERRRLTFIDLPREELALELDLELRPPADSPEPVTLGVTPFGMLGVRVARTLRVHDRLGGLIVNSQEGENEADCFAQHAAWCDYSGPVPLAPPAGGDGKKRQDGDSLPAVIVGISCFDHPENGEGERQWHVRDDGWMGPSLTRSRPRTVTGERPLRLRYRLEAHLGRPWNARVGDRYRLWRKSV